MHRMVRSRRHLAGLLRRRPILDSMVLDPSGGPGARPTDDLRTILEMMDGATGPDGTGEERDPGDPSLSPREQSHLTGGVDRLRS